MSFFLETTPVLRVWGFRTVLRCVINHSATYNWVPYCDRSFLLVGVRFLTSSHGDQLQLMYEITRNPLSLQL